MEKKGENFKALFDAQTSTDTAMFWKDAEIRKERQKRRAERRQRKLQLREQLKAKETHEFGYEWEWDAPAEGCPDATDPMLMVYHYKNKKIKMTVFYCFPDKSNGGIFKIDADVQGNRQQVVDQLTERYGYPVTQTEYVAKFEPQDKPYTVSLSGIHLRYTLK